MNDERGSGVIITLDNIYEQVLATKDIARTLVDKVEAIEKRDSDHEARIRTLEQRPVTADHEPRLQSLERKLWMAAGAAAVAGGGVVQGLHSIFGG